MTIVADVQKFEPGTLVDLYVLDATALGGLVAYLHPTSNSADGGIPWQGVTYEPFPFVVTGIERTTRGPAPRPTARAANVNGLMGALCIYYGNMIGAKVTRKRTFARYLDGAAEADPNAHFPDEVYIIDRKAAEGKDWVEWELASAFDLDGVMLPRRQVIANVCTWRYRSAECGWVGGAVATATDAPTSDISKDACGKRLSSCKLRWGANAELPFGGFPAAGLIR